MPSASSERPQHAPAQPLRVWLAAWPGRSLRVRAAFFCVSDRLGTIGPDKQADLVLIDGHPLRDIKSLRRAPGVLLGDRWVVLPNAPSRDD
jgi:hypothetical protein